MHRCFWYNHAMCIDLKSGWEARMKALPVFLLLAIILLPIEYALLWKLACATHEPDKHITGCLGLPTTRAEAWHRLRNFHIGMLVIAMIILLFWALY